ncbi:hypothetical protein EUTSA_v10015189mg [Eutrema salsugineum]|uniref:Uncharacterized protein n=1 Tax=Eutrema salsugineum TaxID=72664 RepID=V4LMH6_EUTSA|nr:hypothetical protein EUTSA_v10015189mg [Eutrema salsugineum]
MDRSRYPYEWNRSDRRVPTNREINTLSKDYDMTSPQDSLWCSSAFCDMVWSDVSFAYWQDEVPFWCKQDKVETA